VAPKLTRAATFAVLTSPGTLFFLTMDVPRVISLIVAPPGAGRLQLEQAVERDERVAQGAGATMACRPANWSLM
jgi:hypothetical protein